MQAILEGEILILEPVVQCFDCRCVFRGTECPECKSDRIVKLCEKQVEHIFKKVRREIPSHNETVNGVSFCEVCGQPVCPACNNHDCISLSRVTGYIQSVSGFNAAKQQELKDRKRYNLS